MAPRNKAYDSDGAVEGCGSTRYSNAFKRRVYEHVNKYAKANNWYAAWQLGSTFVMWASCFFLPLWTIPLHALLMIRLFVLYHDMAHNSFFSSSLANRVFGTLVGPCTLSPYTYWRDGHDFHHHHSNDLDYQQLSQTAPYTVAAFRAFSPFYQRVYRLMTVPIIAVTVVAPAAMGILQPLSATTGLDWAVQLGIWAVLWSQGVLHRQFLALFLSATLGVFLFHLQHTFPGLTRDHGEAFTAAAAAAQPAGADFYFHNGMDGSTFLQVPWWLRFFTASIEVHHIHHLSARVPNYRLYECHRTAPAGMFDGVPRMTLAQGWASLQLTLYDEGKRRLVTLGEADAELAAQRAAAAKLAGGKAF